MLTNEQIEKLHSRWYDNRAEMPPASYESWKAGWDAAIKNITNGNNLSKE